MRVLGNRALGKRALGKRALSAAQVNASLATGIHQQSTALFQLFAFYKRSSNYTTCLYMAACGACA